MTRLTKEEVIIQRDSQGNPLPIEVSLETLDIELLGKKEYPTIEATPMTKGELAELVSVSRLTEKGIETDKQVDDEIIAQHLIDPKMSQEEITSMRPFYKDAMIFAILSISTGVKQQKIKEESIKKVLEMKDAEFKKKSPSLEKKEKTEKTSPEKQSSTDLDTDTHDPMQYQT